MSNRQTAQILGFHKSSMGRELRRNSVRGRYCSTAADRLAINRRQEIEPKKKLNHPVKPPLFGPVVMRVSVFHERASWQDCMGACGAERSEA
ncbi:MAG: hypothetical protein ACOYI9_12935 [Candidatus Hydrogenedentales bacterium]